MSSLKLLPKDVGTCRFIASPRWFVWSNRRWADSLHSIDDMHYIHCSDDMHYTTSITLHSSPNVLIKYKMSSPLHLPLHHIDDMHYVHYVPYITVITVITSFVASHWWHALYSLHPLHYCHYSHYIFRNYNQIAMNAHVLLCRIPLNTARIPLNIANEYAS